MFIVVTAIVKEPTRGDIAEMIASKAQPRLALYLAKRQLIAKTGEDTYSVPSCSGRGRYTVRYDGKVEDLEVFAEREPKIEKD
jgi:hypothetical protein